MTRLLLGARHLTASAAHALAIALILTGCESMAPPYERAPPSRRRSLTRARLQPWRQPSPQRRRPSLRLLRSPLQRTGVLLHRRPTEQIDRVGLGLPLYRQAALLGRFGGTDISRSTVAGSIVRVGQALQPVVNLLWDELLDAPLVFGDETELQVLKEPGRSAPAKTYIWAQITDGSTVKPRISSNS